MLRPVKRAIFRKRSIDVCLDQEVLATPIGPAALVFVPGEEVVVAVPKNTTKAAGEYQFLFCVETYLGENATRAEKLFGQPAWRHFYRLASATSISPFSLDDVIALGGADRGSEIWERCHGQTQHHRIIRHIQLEDEPLFRHFIQTATEPVWVASAVVEANEVAAVRRRVRKRQRKTSYAACSRWIAKVEIRRLESSTDREEAKSGIQNLQSSSVPYMAIGAKSAVYS
jgi:hypothetical protein